MKGERVAWFKLASHLHLPLQETMEKTTSKEFLEWIAFIEMERNEREKIDYYLALIATEVRRSYVKNPRSVNVEDMLLNFKPHKAQEVPLSQAEGEPDKRIAISKAYWFGVLGVNHVRV